MSTISQDLLMTLYLRNFWFCRIFFRAKLPPGTAKTVFANPLCILESWDQMPSHGFDKNLIWRNLFFQHPLDLQKRFLQCQGVILHEKKFCKTRSSSNMSKIALLSASGWNPKSHIYHTPYSTTESSQPNYNHNHNQTNTCRSRAAIIIVFVEFGKTRLYHAKSSERMLCRIHNCPDLWQD